MHRPLISLIIPAHNEEKYLGRTLSSVIEAIEAFKKPGPDSPVELIVVNNCSTDKTEEIALRFGAKVVFESERRIASVRNAGARAARGELVAFLNADSCVTPGIFNSVHEAMSSGRCIGGGTDIKLDRRSLGIFCTYCITKYPARWLWGVAGGLIFTKRATFENLGGFDESLYCGEETGKYSYPPHLRHAGASASVLFTFRWRFCKPAHLWYQAPARSAPRW